VKASPAQGLIRVGDERGLRRIGGFEGIRAGVEIELQVDLRAGLPRGRRRLVLASLAAAAQRGGQNDKIESPEGMTAGHRPIVVTRHAVVKYYGNGNPES
jgi:hypothetical protein